MSSLPAAMPACSESRDDVDMNVDMNVELTPDQRAFVQKAIDSGRFARAEEAVEEALALWEERERKRLEIIAMLDEGDASFARGQGIPLTEESVTDRCAGSLRLGSP